jgi:hypothetical protein
MEINGFHGKTQTFITRQCAATDCKPIAYFDRIMRHEHRTSFFRSHNSCMSQFFLDATWYSLVATEVQLSYKLTTI